MPTYEERNELIKALSNQAYFDALSKPKAPNKAIQDVGVDGQTGRSLLSHPDGGLSSNGVKRFNTAAPQDGFVAARIDRNSNAIAIDGRQRKQGDRVSRLIELDEGYPIIKFPKEAPLSNAFFGGAFNLLFCEATGTFFSVSSQGSFGNTGIAKIGINDEADIKSFVINNGYINSIAYSKKAQRIYAITASTRELFIINPFTNSLESTVVVGVSSAIIGFKDIIYIPETNRLYFGSINQKLIIVFNPETNSIESFHEIAEFANSAVRVLLFCPKTSSRNTKIVFYEESGSKFVFFDIIAKTYVLYTGLVIAEQYGQAIFNEATQTIWGNSTSTLYLLNIDTGAVTPIVIPLPTDGFFMAIFSLENTIYMGGLHSVVKINAIDFTIFSESILEDDTLLFDYFTAVFCSENERFYRSGIQQSLNNLCLVPYNTESDEFS